MGKHVERKYGKEKERRDVQVLDLIHSNIIGPLPKLSSSNSRNVLAFIDDFSRYYWVYFLKLKSEVFETFKVYKALVENECGKNIKVIRTKNGKGCDNENFQQLCEEYVIQMQHCVPYIPRQNGVAERKNIALKEMTTCMMEAKDLNPNIWDKYINCDAYFQNISPHNALYGNLHLRL